MEELNSWLDSISPRPALLRSAKPKKIKVRPSVHTNEDKRRASAAKGYYVGTAWVPSKLQVTGVQVDSAPAYRTVQNNLELAIPVETGK